MRARHPPPAVPDRIGRPLGRRNSPRFAGDADRGLADPHPAAPERRIPPLPDRLFEPRDLRGARRVVFGRHPAQGGDQEAAGGFGMRHPECLAVEDHLTRLGAKDGRDPFGRRVSEGALRDRQICRYS